MNPTQAKEVFTAWYRAPRVVNKTATPRISGAF